MESTVSLTCICGIQHPELKEAHEIMKSADSPPDTKYEFLGDNMNGNIETFLLLIGLKCLFPERIMLIRNQDSRQTTRLYGYYDECIRKYGNAALWESMEHLSGVAMDKRVFMFKEWFECEAIGAIRKDSH
ncbi:hypothetical protein GCK72_011699 [Caenorhabditis remanei]|uniref:Uncharacterized protein n=1 Tax=Caenorhabditis remanei TaxID=31234 RepID=A0A6A5HAH2_CAERE|nr:hypothetical protein GCK72_011699 [Caenorhabditis remanei]KAF1763433.1 hypothetical protein GCK72_011699 [Caenorhabditis remanei]